MAKRDILIAREGSSLTGEFLEKTVTIRSIFGPVRVQTSAIAWIHFQGTPGMKTDEVWLHNGDRLSGSIEGTKVRWRISSKETFDVPHDLIHSIVFSGMK